MIPMQMPAYTPNGKARAFQSHPPIAPIVAAVSTRLMMEAARDGVEQHEHRDQADQSREQSSASTVGKDWLFHAVKYALRTERTQDGR